MTRGMGVKNPNVQYKYEKNEKIGNIFLIIPSTPNQQKPLFLV